MQVKGLRAQDASGILLQSSLPSPVEYSNVLPRPYILNGHVQETYSNQISTFSLVFAILLLAQLLLLYLYVSIPLTQIEHDLAGLSHAQCFLYASSVTAFTACAVLITRYCCQQPDYEMVVDFKESLPELLFKVAAILISPYGYLE